MPNIFQNAKTTGTCASIHVYMSITVTPEEIDTWGGSLIFIKLDVLF